MSKPTRSSTSRRLFGQGLVEFALILPVLLLILFGIIEIARLLQAWLAVENAARFAVRYAVTGDFNPQYCDEANQYYLPPPTGLGHTIPGLTVTLAILDDTAIPTSGATADPANDCNIPRGVANYVEKTEALQDWARLASIRDAGQAGAPGTFIVPGVSPDYVNYLLNTASTFDPTYRGNPSASGFFNITTCSNRSGVTMGDQTTAQYMSGHNGEDLYRYPDYCQVPFNPPTDPPTNRYIDDGGGPGNRVRVVVTFRHPMIMPFLSSLWPNVRLVAQRESTVEQFRTTKNIVLPGAIGAAATFTSTPTKTPTASQTSTASQTPTASKTATPTSTPTRTSTATQTRTATAANTATNTPTRTQTPTKTATANCANFSLGTFTQTNTGGATPKPRMSINVTNGSAQATTITALTFTWTAYDSANPGQTVDAIRWPDTVTSISGTDDFNSPTSWSGSAALNAAQTGVLSFDFKNADAAWPGIVTAADFALTLTLGNGCPLSVTAQPTKTPTITPTPSKTLTPTITPTPSKTFTPSQTFTPSKTFTPSQTFTKTATKTITPTPSKTLTPTQTDTPPPFSPTPTRTASKTWTPTPTKSATPTGPPPTSTPTRTVTPTPSKTSLPTFTPACPIDVSGFPCNTPGNPKTPFP